MRSFRLDILPRLLFVVAMLCLGRTAYATEQYPDYIEYGGKKFGTELYRYCSDGKTYYFDYQGFATFTN